MAECKEETKAMEFEDVKAAVKEAVTETANGVIVLSEPSVDSIRKTYGIPKDILEADRKLMIDLNKAVAELAAEKLVTEVEAAKKKGMSVEEMRDIRIGAKVVVNKTQTNRIFAKAYAKYINRLDPAGPRIERTCAITYHPRIKVPTAVLEATSQYADKLKGILIG